MATASSTTILSPDGSMSPQLIEYLEAMEDRIVSRILNALPSGHGTAAAPEQMPPEMTSVGVALVQDAVLAENSSANEGKVGLVSCDVRSPD
jgi:hypothetical protein